MNPREDREQVNDIPMTGISPGRAAYEARIAAESAACGFQLRSAWDTMSEPERAGWEAGADAVVAPVCRERDEARADLAKAGELIRSLERIMKSWGRGMYAARIDCWRGDPEAAAATLSEGLDGYDGPEWDRTETGTAWWERTKAEEGL